MAAVGRTGEGTERDQFRLIAKLNDEWSALCELETEVGGWVQRHPSLAGCRKLAEVLERVADAPDQVLGSLLIESAGGSTLAARTVLQAMLGKVVLMARADPGTGVHAHLVALWERIRTYPIDRRPRHIPANLALDARKLARREGRPTVIAPWPPGAAFTDLVDRQILRETADHGLDISILTAGDIIRAAVELELINGDAEALLNSVYAEGLTSVDAAQRHVMSPQTVRQRCSRVVRHLASHSHELASTA